MKRHPGETEIIWCNIRLCITALRSSVCISRTAAEPGLCVRRVSCSDFTWFHKALSTPPTTPSKTHVSIFISGAHKLCNHYVTFVQQLTKSLAVRIRILRRKANLLSSSPYWHIVLWRERFTCPLGGFFIFQVVQHWCLKVWLELWLKSLCSSAGPCFAPYGPLLLLMQQFFLYLSTPIVDYYILDGIIFNLYLWILWTPACEAEILICHHRNHIRLRFDLKHKWMHLTAQVTNIHKQETGGRNMTCSGPNVMKMLR